MRPLSDAARIRIGDESLIKIRVENPIDSVVDEAIAHARLVNIARLGVGDAKVMITPMAIGFVLQISMQC